MRSLGFTGKARCVRMHRMSTDYNSLALEIRQMVDANLMPGEEIIWKGKQGAAPSRNRTLTIFSVAALAIVLLLCLYVAINTMNGPVLAVMIFIIIAVLVAILDIILVYRNFSQTAVVLTNYRAIKAYRKVHSYRLHGTGYKGITDVKITNRKQDGTADVIFYYIDGRTGHRGWGFLSMDNPEEIRDIVLKRKQEEEAPATLPVPETPVWDKLSDGQREWFANAMQEGESPVWACTPAGSVKAARGKGKVTFYALSSKRALVFNQQGTVIEEYPLHINMMQDHEVNANGGGKLVLAYDVKDMSDFSRQHEQGFLHLRNVAEVENILATLQKQQG